MKLLDKSFSIYFKKLKAERKNETMNMNNYTIKSQEAVQSAVYNLRKKKVSKPSKQVIC